MDEPSEQPTPEPSKHDSAIDVSNDDKESLGKLDEPTVSEPPKEIAPQEPVQVYTVHTDVPDSPLTSPEYAPEDSPLTSPHYTPEDLPTPEPPKQVHFGDDQITVFSKNDPPNTIEGLQPPSEAPQPGPSVLKQPPPQALQPGIETEIAPIITEEDGLTDITIVNGNKMTTSTYDENGEIISVMVSRWDENLEMWVPYKETTDYGIQQFTPVITEEGGIGGSPTPDSPEPPTPEPPQAEPSRPPKRPFDGDDDPSAGGPPPSKKGKEKAE